MPTKEAKSIGNSSSITKRFTNGHKQFTAEESGGFKQTLNVESRKREEFFRNKDFMIKPRNPMTGEPTPRDIDGNRLLCPGDYMKVVHANPLFPKDRPPSVHKETKGILGKIGECSGRYEVLGNVDLSKTLAQPEDLYAKSRYDYERKLSSAREKELMATVKINVDAKRHEKMLEREILALKLQLADKEAELRLLRDRTYSGIT